MAEPTTSGAAGVVGFKMLGGLSGIASIVAAVAAGLASVVVMCMNPPRHKREWVVGIISTVVSSIGGGAYAMHRFGFADLATQGPVGLAILFGMVFACGLPGWFIVRAAFTWMDRRANQDLGEVVTDATKTVADAKRNLTQ